MAITLNGTTGISSPGGDTSTSLATTNLSYTGTLTGGTGVIAIGTNQIYKDASGNVGIGTTSPGAKLHLTGSNVQFRMTNAAGTPTTRHIALVDSDNTWRFTRTGIADDLTIDNSGNVGIGTASPSTYGKLAVLSSDNTEATVIQSLISNNTTAQLRLGFNRIVGYNTTAGNSSLDFGVTSYPQAVRIDSSGNLLVGCTSINPLGSTRLVLSENSGTTKWAVGPIDIAVNNFYVYAASGTGVFLSGTSATSWSSNSDERLKTDLKPIENAAQKVATLRAVTGRYKTDVEGFSRAFLIAQDVQKVLPEAVGYTKLVGADDETDYLALAYTDTIPLLVKAIQELTTRLEALEAK